MTRPDPSRYIMTLVMLAIFVTMVGVASTYPAGARFMVFVVGFPAIALCLLQLVLDFRLQRQPNLAPTPETPAEAVAVTIGQFQDPSRIERGPGTARRELIVWGYFLSLIAGILLFGFYITVPVFLITFLRFFANTTWQRAVILTGLAWLILYGLFSYVFRMSLHPGFITDYLMDRISG
jgi:hypothetical protein